MKLTGKSGNQRKMTSIALVLIDEIPEFLLDMTETLAEIFNAEIDIIYRKVSLEACSKKSLPEHVQYNAEEALELVRKEMKNRLFLAITNKDLFVQKLNFVFGLASYNSAIISIRRLKSDDKNIFLCRALKEAVHELGHVFGLSHCPDPDCVMHFSDSLSDTDSKSSHPCSACADILKNTLEKEA